VARPDREVIPAWLIGHEPYPNGTRVSFAEREPLDASEQVEAAGWGIAEETIALPQVA
jgi:hypothetical protein